MRLLGHRLKDDGATFEDEVSLRDTMSQVYLGTLWRAIIGFHVLHC